MENHISDLDEYINLCLLQLITTEPKLQLSIFEIDLLQKFKIAKLYPAKGKRLNDVVR